VYIFADFTATGFGSERPKAMRIHADPDLDPKRRFLQTSLFKEQEFVRVSVRIIYCINGWCNVNLNLKDAGPG
jgi:hypothetical protein